MFHRNRVRVAVLGAAGIAIALGVTTLASAAPSQQSSLPVSAAKPTVVLVEGAWSSSDSWKGVIDLLHGQGSRPPMPPVDDDDLIKPRHRRVVGLEGV